MQTNFSIIFISRCPSQGRKVIKNRIATGLIVFGCAFSSCFSASEERKVPTLFKFIDKELWSVSSMKENLLEKYTSGTLKVSYSKTLSLNGNKTGFRIKAFDNCAGKIFVGGKDSKGEFLAKLSDTKTGILQKISVSEKELFPVRDILDLSQLGVSACLVLGVKLYLFDGKKQSLRLVVIPELLKIPYATLQEEAKKGYENPFKSWQENFQISQEVAYHGALAENTIVLSYPHRARILLGKYQGKTKEIGDWHKWGAWGVRKGEFQLPMSLTYLASPKLIAVSDAIAGDVSFYSMDGEYRGHLEKQFKQLYSITGSGDRLVVFDIEDGKPIEVKISESTIKNYSRTFGSPASLLEFKRCKRCHESHEYFSIRGDSPFITHHPTGALRNGNLVVICSTCHDGHHSKGNKFNLNKKHDDLCFTCHKDKKNPKENHLVPKNGCASCHNMHNPFKRLTVQSLGKLCFNCHPTSKTPVSHPFDVLDDYCLSCHSVHNADKSKNLPRTSPDAKFSSCLICHDKFKSIVNKKVHLTSEKMNGLSERQWIYPGGTCLACHNPHAKKVDSLILCSTCHSDKTAAHKSLGGIAETARAKGVETRNGRIVCITCHDPHGLTENPFQLKETASISVLCSSCHGKDSNNFVESFHSLKSPSKGKK